jgi:hypothetical protein
MWNLSYVAIGAALSTDFSLWRLAETLAAFFFGLGVSAHALDELNGRPLRTQISDRTLIVAATVSLLIAVALGIKEVGHVGLGLVPFIAIGALAVIAYNLEWFGGAFHTDAGFALLWGAFPVLVGYFVEARSFDLSAVVVAGGAFGLALAQRVLSTETRFLRRRVRNAHMELELDDGQTREVDRAHLVIPFDMALKTMSWAVAALAIGLVLARLGN